MKDTSRWRRRSSVLGATAVMAVVATQAVAVQQPAFAAATAPVYTVTQEGLTKEQAQKIADTFQIANVLADNGSFDYIDGASFANVPSKVVGRGIDESGRMTIADGLDLVAAAQIKPISDVDAIERGNRLLEMAGLTADLRAEPEVSHTQLTISDRGGKVQLDQSLDTSVIYRLSIDGLPVTGSGARLRITFGPDGTTTQLSHALRTLTRGDDLPIISPGEAARACSALYPVGVRQDEPTLGYQFPELTARDATGEGSVATIFPQYTCNPVAGDVVLPQVLVPAVADAGPTAKFAVTLADGGRTVSASASVDGGTAPYTVRWGSSTTAVTATGESVSYVRDPRDGGATEHVTIEVTDANGLTATGSVTLDQDGTASATTVPGGGGFGVFSIPRVDGGTETPVTTGTCGTASNVSADGFKNALTAHGAAIQFDWRGDNAWEADFKDPSRAGGDDSRWVDDVDIAWYSGHGSPSSFTFNTNHTDTNLSPADARWGNRDLEWLQLQSCNVLEDTSGTHDYFGRWGPSFGGLHILNGFDTVAGCVTAGLGGAFADRLFPGAWGAGLTVQKAWAAAVIARDPGRKYRSMGPLGKTVSNGTTVYTLANLNDHFWGQGTTGPDVPSPSGYWAISGWS